MKTKSLCSKQNLLTLSSFLGAAMMLLTLSENARAQWNPSPSPSPNTNIYYNAGNVGIGTNAPVNLLDVGSAGIGTFVGNAVTVSNTSGYSSFGIGQSPTARGRMKWVYNATEANAYLSLGDSAGTHPLILQEAGGKVGIGTTSFPSFTGATGAWGSLNVLNGVSVMAPTLANEVGYDLILPSFRPSGQANGWSMRFAAANAVGGCCGGVPVPIRSLMFFSDISNGTGSGNAGIKIPLWLEESGNVIMGTNTGTGFAGGNVGIGTAAPAAKLDVAGQIRSSTGGFVFPDGTVQTTAGGSGTSQWTTIAGPNIYYNAGNVGIGTSTPTAKLHVDGGSIRLAQTAGETPFQIYSYSNSDSLWLTSGNATKSEIQLSPGYAIDYDRSISLQYSPGTTGAAAGSMVIGQLSKNNAAWTHGNTAFFTAGAERLRINSSGNVGIGTTTPNYRLEISKAQSGNFNGLHIYNASGSPFSSNDSVSLSLGRSSGHIMGQLTASNKTTGDFGDGYLAFSTRKAEVVSERVRIDENGNVGIGKTNPGYLLDVNGNVNATGFLINGTPISTGGGSQWIGTTNISYNGGNVGIGTTSAPAEKLEVAGSVYISGNYLRFPHAFGDLNDGKIGNSMFGQGLNLVGINNDNTFRKFQLWGQITQNQNDGTNTWAGINYFNGNVGIGVASPTTKLDVQGNGKFTGNLTVDGNIAAKYQDVAEWVPSSEQVSAGTVVVLDTTKSNQVVSSTVSYDTRVAGVVSERPGLALGEEGAGKVLVATTGRVLVKVDASRGPIHIGDLLVTSDVPGVAMKSEPGKVGQRMMHLPGTLIGKALEPLEKGSGKILVLLSLQ